MALSQTDALPAPCCAGWESEVVAEAVRRTKAALNVSPDTLVEARLSHLELRAPRGTVKVKTAFVYVSCRLRTRCCELLHMGGPLGAHAAASTVGLVLSPTALPPALDTG